MSEKNERQLIDALSLAISTLQEIAEMPAEGDDAWEMRRTALIALDRISSTS